MPNCSRKKTWWAVRPRNMSNRLAELGARVQATPGEDSEWNAHEILAHRAAVSKFYGVLVHRVASGQMSELTLLEAVNLRDPAGKQMAELEPAELVKMTLADHARTIKTLRGSDPDSLRKTVRVDDGTTMTAEEIARLPLITHLEMHLEQLEQMLGSSR